MTGVIWSDSIWFAMRTWFWLTTSPDCSAFLLRFAEVKGAAASPCSWRQGLRKSMEPRPICPQSRPSFWRAENVLELFGVVGAEEDVQLAGRTARGDQEIGELEVVGNSNDTRASRSAKRSCSPL